MLNADQKDRYQRHLIMPDFSEQEQLKLLNAKVLVIGAGGLGAPVLQYLGASGVGTIGILDKDTVSKSNLHRQVLFTQADEGKLKTSLASKRLIDNNKDCNVLEYNLNWTSENSSKIARQYDLIIDCTDNFESRIATDQASQTLNIPFVYGAILGWEGQVSVFNYNGCKSYCESLNIDKNKLPDTKGPIGVIGVTPAIIGSLQATEAIKIITGLGKVISGQLLLVSLKTNIWKLLDL